MLHPEFKKALDDTEEIELIVTGRRSGRKKSRPVWFVREGNKLYLLPVKGSDTEWFKNVLKNPTIGLDADGTKVTEKAPSTAPATSRSTIQSSMSPSRCPSREVTCPNDYVQSEPAIRPVEKRG